MVAGDLRYLAHADIDKAQWDQCIIKSQNSRVYAQSVYLDALAENWDALVLGEYDVVMPLTWKKKYGIHYLYQPLLCAQLGVFGNNINASVVAEFLNSIPKHFKYWDISMNSGNEIDSAGLIPKWRVNFIKSLEDNYEAIEKNYRENVKRNIRKSIQAENVIDRDVNIEEIINIAISQSHGNDVGESFNRFKTLEQKPKTFRFKKYGIRTKNGELLSSAVFVVDHNRAYYLLVGNHPNGRTLGASHALIDAFIKDHAGSSIILDFEGSDIRNLAFFYSSFGATEEKYPALVKNNLPWVIRWIKP